MNKNENALCQNLWDVANTIFRGKFMPLNYYIKTSSQISNLKFHLELEKEKQSKPKSYKKEEIIHIKAKINEVKKNSTNQTNQKTHSQ